MVITETGDYKISIWNSGVLFIKQKDINFIY